MKKRRQLPKKPSTFLLLHPTDRQIPFCWRVTNVWAV
jgi:hypothetical protein